MSRRLFVGHGSTLDDEGDSSKQTLMMMICRSSTVTRCYINSTIEESRMSLLGNTQVTKGGQRGRERERVHRRERRIAELWCCRVDDHSSPPGEGMLPVLLSKIEVEKIVTCVTHVIVAASRLHVPSVMT